MTFQEKFLADGWLRIGGIFDRALIDAVRAEFETQYEALVASGPEGLGLKPLGEHRMQLSVQIKGPLLDPRLYANPLLLTILTQLLGNDMVLDSFACIVTFPGAQDQPPHRDYSKLFPEAGELDWNLLPFGVIVGIPLVDLTPENGTMKLFPGIGEVESSEAELPGSARGDCFILDYRTRHQGTANRSTEPRPVLYLVYSRPWFIDMMNFRRQPRINLDPADFSQIPEVHRPLFRRLAAKGSFNRSEAELFESGPQQGLQGHNGFGG